MNPNLQLLQTCIMSTESKLVPDLELCLKKVEYAVKRAERERLRWVAADDYIDDIR